MELTLKKPYILNPLNQVTGHGHWPAWHLRDGDDVNVEELRVQVWSGDYFATLATTLDQLSQTLAAKHASESEALSQIVSNLLYLQNHYEIVDKD